MTPARARALARQVSAALVEPSALLTATAAPGCSARLEAAPLIAVRLVRVAIARGFAASPVTAFQVRIPVTARLRPSAEAAVLPTRTVPAEPTAAAELPASRIVSSRVTARVVPPAPQGDVTLAVWYCLMPARRTRVAMRAFPRTSISQSRCQRLWSWWINLGVCLRRSARTRVGTWFTAH